MSSEAPIYHIPALLSQSVDLLDVKADGVYVDATFGGGGHSREILKRLGPEGRLFGFDRDIDAMSNVPKDSRFTFVLSDFRFIPNFLEYYGEEKVDGILADLGVSFHHFDTPERGFSFRSDAPLDMRMNRKGGNTAAEIINNSSGEDLKEILKKYTDLRNHTNIAAKILEIRKQKPIESTFELVRAVEPLLDPRNLKKELAQVFQALRIRTNDEFSSLRQLLCNSLEVLKKGGRLAVLTYHSGEDRLVKDFFKTGSFEAEQGVDLIYGTPKSPWKLITRNPVIASEEEIISNPRARSAKLRVAQKK